jgi:hypothetical protein
MTGSSSSCSRRRAEQRACELIRPVVLFGQPASVRRFATGLRADLAAVRAGITEI